MVTFELNSRNLDTEVTISKIEYKQLIQNDEMMAALKLVGITDWDKYKTALEIYERSKTF